MAQHEEDIINICDDITQLAVTTYKFQETENNVFSPLSLHTLLSLIYQDLSYRHATDFGRIMGLKREDDAIKRYENFISFLRSTFQDSLFFPKKIFLKNNCGLDDYFKATLNNFLCAIDSANFTESETCTKLINSCIETETKGSIKDLISSSDLTNDTRLALVNALYFNEKWSIPFELETEPRKFHLNGQDDIQVQMMKATGEFLYKYDQSKKQTVIELPYTRDDVSLILVLPDEGCKLDEHVGNVWYWRDIAYDLAKTNMDVILPRFKVEHLGECIDKAKIEEGIGKNAHIFGMLDNDEFLKFETLNKKTFVSVDEDGTEMGSGLAFTALPNDVEKETAPVDGLKVLETNINSTVSNRFAKTLVTYKIQNCDQSAKEARFTTVLPEKAFITEFVMEIDGKRHKASIKEKEEAKAIYEEAVSVGKSAGIVETDTRDSSQFDISVNLEPQSTAIFLLTYEEMLERIHDQYELVLNICPGQIVDKIHVEVNINESRPLKFVRTPPLRSGTEVIPLIEKYLKPSADIKISNSNVALIGFNPDAQQQRKLCYYLGTPVSKGFSGQFVVQYDVERDPTNGEILLQDGYFVHFFAPNDLDPLPKHVVFVLDTSTSMSGGKIEQLKDAMMSILSELRKDDLINIIDFNSEVIAWDLNHKEKKILSIHKESDFKEPFGEIGENVIPDPIYVNDEVIEKAKAVVGMIKTGGCTFIIGGLVVALYLIKKGQEKFVKNSKYQPMVVFLTDGQPNVGMNSPQDIVEAVTRLNMKYTRAPIFSLSFGEEADKAFLRELSAKNFGFSRHIYEASDASLQLQSFYRQISSPLLSDIDFKYESDITEITRSHFPIYFRGSELVVSGRCRGCSVPTTIQGYGSNGIVSLPSNAKSPVSSLERLWAYLTVKQLLEGRSYAEKKEELTKRAIDLALKYSFVTEVTSLVVVKPEEAQDIDYGVDTKSSELEFRRMLKKRKYCKYGDMCEGMKPDCVDYCYLEELPEEISITEVIPTWAVKKPKKKLFLADRPFLIILMVKKGHSEIIPFIGHVYKPCF